MLSRTRKGFTLLELIVVIVILGILAAIAIPTFKAVIDKSKYASLKESAQATANNAVALAAFNGLPVAAGFNGAVAADTTALVTAINELPAGTTGSIPAYTGAVNNFNSRFVVFQGVAADVKADSIVACVALPTVVNGAAKVSKTPVTVAANTAPGVAAVAAFNNACLTAQTSAF